MKLAGEPGGSFCKPPRQSGCAPKLRAVARIAPASGNAPRCSKRRAPAHPSFATSKVKQRHLRPVELASPCAPRSRRGSCRTTWRRGWSAFTRRRRSRCAAAAPAAVAMVVVVAAVAAVGAAAVGAPTAPCARPAEQPQQRRPGSTPARGTPGSPLPWSKNRHRSVAKMRKRYTAVTSTGVCLFVF